MVVRSVALRLPAILLAMLFAFDVYALQDVVPVATLYPEEPPTRVTFFFSAGGPLERFTSKPDAWYALYRLPLYPNQAYAILLSHEEEPERIRVFALDRSPFDAVSMKYELQMAKVDWQPLYRKGTRHYESVVSLPIDAAAPGIYLLVEWTPPPGPAAKPPPLLFQVLTANSTYLERRRPQRSWWSFGNSGSFNEQRAVILPVPRQRDGTPHF
ncbi:MAG TPA: hypothetical protein DCR97_09115 [Deltaproteobacteria bacterium]|nr:hypothetical protein [Deltaproteobacteria bacterium]